MRLDMIMEFEDRYMRYPLYLHYKGVMEKAMSKHQSITPQLLKEKTRFCTFVVSNGKADELTSAVF